MPRLAVLAVERNDVLTRYVEKSDTFARTLVASGTFGFLPGVPSAYTQPLYAWFLAGLYWPLERTWLVVGLAQIAVATATVLVVLAIGRRLSSVTTGVIAALVATLHPYLVWHDVHVNRGVSCVSCHGQVNEMPLMWKTQSLRMQWCLDCHRNPAPNLRPPEQVFNMTWHPEVDPNFSGRSKVQIGEELMKKYKINSYQLTNCSICHY